MDDFWVNPYQSLAQSIYLQMNVGDLATLTWLQAFLHEIIELLLFS